ncbi:MAG: 30S ribosomal protein S6 [Desulfovibrionaceae bacterium]|nr:30S ribosomal protein S6 [Desulfovibrionaceae bacterium]
MRTFETLILLSPELTTENRDTLLASFTDVVNRFEGKVVAVDHWGMRDLAYPVRKQMRGYYVRLEYTAPGETVAELERIIRISDGVYKFITVKLAENAEEEVA